MSMDTTSRPSRSTYAVICAPAMLNRGRVSFHSDPWAGLACGVNVAARLSSSTALIAPVSAVAVPAMSNSFIVTPSA